MPTIQASEKTRKDPTAKIWGTTREGCIEENACKDKHGGAKGREEEHQASTNKLLRNQLPRRHLTQRDRWTTGKDTPWEERASTATDPSGSTALATL